MLECREDFLGGRHRATSPTEVQGGGGGYGAGWFKNWWEGMSCEPRGNNKSDGQERRDTQTLTKKKKNDQKEKKIRY